MNVKRYIVDSMPDALQQIRHDLGKDAVILNTREIRVGGFLGMFRKRRIEVIAAVDGPTEPVRAPVAETAPLRTVPYRQASLSYKSRSQPAADAMPQAPDGLQPKERPEQEPAAADRSPPESAASAPLRFADLPPSPSVEEKFAEADKLLEEIRQMKEMIRRLTERQFAVGNAAAADGLPRLEPVWEEARELLLRQEVMPELADELVQRAKARLQEAAETAGDGEPAETPPHPSGEPPDAQTALTALRSELQRVMDEHTSPIWEDGVRLIHFVGPTGVGKTTTIAKLAAEQALKYRRKIGLITLDTYRIAAVEQLRTYANILNAPLEVVFSPQDMAKALEQLQDCDLIFTDTAGRNYRNEMYVSELNAMLRPNESSRTVLVLSLTMKYPDMRQIAENFCKFRADHVLFTKLDETESFGAILNVIHEFPLRLSYVADGQNVPDDIAAADSNRLAGCLLGEQTHG